MEILGKGGTAHKARFAGAIAVVLTMLCGAETANAQSTPSAGTSVDKAPSEAARRAALSPYRFILQNATAPARKPTPAAAASPSPAVAEPKRPAAAPVQQAAAQPSAAAPAPSAKPSEAQPASAPEPAPAVASLSRAPVEPPPPRLEIIPVRTDEPHLPASMPTEQRRGTVKVQFEIQTDGSVGEVKVLSSTNRPLNRPTLEAVRGWKFEPVDATLTVETDVIYTMDN